MRARLGAILALTLALPACGQQGPASLLTALPSASQQTGSLAAGAAEGVAAEASIVSAGSPTDIYAQVARSALNCWFGADGPLKRSHIFHAEAAPPTKGGAAEIVLQVRDASLPDQRGIRAFRVTFAEQGPNTLVNVSGSRLDPLATAAMIEDVAHWARGEPGCRLQAEMPPVASAPTPPSAARLMRTRAAP